MISKKDALRILPKEKAEHYIKIGYTMKYICGITGLNYDHLRLIEREYVLVFPRMVNQHAKDLLTKDYLLECKSKGMKRQEIADAANVSLPTVNNYLTLFFGRKTQKKIIATKPMRRLSAVQRIGVYSKWVSSSPKLRPNHGCS